MFAHAHSKNDIVLFTLGKLKTKHRKGSLLRVTRVALAECIQYKLRIT